VKQHQLRALVAIAECGSIRAAARAISLSQTALTKAMQELEEDLHVTLMVRSSQGVQLTPIGLELLERARSILGEIASARAHVESFRSGSPVRVAAAAGPAFLMSCLPDILGRFRSRYPHALLSLQDAFLSQTLPKLREGSIDVALITILPEYVGTDLLFESLGEIDIALLVRRGTRREAIPSIAALVDEPWVLDSSSAGVSEVVRRAFAQQDCALPMRSVESFSTVSSLALVEECGFIAPSPRVTLKAAHMAMRFSELELQRPLPRIPFGLLLRRDSKLSPASAWMCECLRAIARQPGWDRLGVGAAVRDLA
jgi:LysR family transcriptional regulator of abg operon